MFLKMKGDTSYMCETQAEGCTVYERSQNQRGISAAESGSYWRWFQDDEGTEHLSCERTGTVWLQGEKVQWRSGCPEGLWSFHPRRYLKATWAWSWDFAVGGPAWAGGWSRWPPEAPSNLSHAVIPLTWASPGADVDIWLHVAIKTNSPGAATTELLNKLSILQNNLWEPIPSWQL